MTALLTLTQWLSPGFPTGAFAYSHGLERVIAQGLVADGPSLQRWLGEVLTFGAGWQDAVLLASALRPGADHGALDDLARALAPSAERLRETMDQGAAFARTVAALVGREVPERALPVALGQTAAPLGLAAETVIALFLQAFAANLCTVAVRHVPLGQTEGQRVLAALAPQIGALAHRAATATIDDLASAVWAADMAAMEHETQTVRIYLT